MKGNDMKRIIITGAALLAVVPASMGLVSNAAFSQSVPVRLPAQVAPASSQSNHLEIGDDKGGLTTHVEAGDDKGGLTTHVEAGDDKGGLTTHVEAGDDKGGLTTHVEAGDDKGGLTTHVEPGDDSSGRGHDGAAKASKDDGPGHS
jgi:hypothetical protein